MTIRHTHAKRCKENKKLSLEAPFEFHISISKCELFPILRKCEEGLFSIAWAPDNKSITVSTGDGRIIVVKPDGSVDKILHSANSAHGLPITALKWRPPSKLLKTEQVLVSGSTNGDIEYWHVPSGKRMSVISEPDNEIYSVSFLYALVVHILIHQW